MARPVQCQQGSGQAMALLYYGFAEHAAQAVQACRLLSLTMVAGSRICGVSKGLTCDG